MEAADFWKAIKENLLKKGKTQEWLCKECDMDLQSMRNRIYKNRFPSIEEALKILAVFDLKPNQFFGVSENNFENADNFAGNSLTSGKNVILVPNLSYAPRACFLPQNTIANGSVALLTIKDKNIVITDCLLIYAD